MESQKLIINRGRNWHHVFVLYELAITNGSAFALEWIPSTVVHL